MIGKTVKGNGFGGVLRYVFEKPQAQCIGSNMLSQTPRALAREFRSVASHNRRVQRPVAHISLSPSPEEELSDLEALDFAMAYLDKIGFSDCQWVLVRHADTQTDDGRPRPHFHIVANRVKSTDSDGVTTPSAAMPDGKWNDLRSLKNALSLSISLT